MTIETSVADKVGRWEVRRPSNVTLLYVARAARGFGRRVRGLITCGLSESNSASRHCRSVSSRPPRCSAPAVLTLCVGYFRLALRLAQPTLDQRMTMIATGVAFANVELFPLLVLVAFARHH